MTRQTTAPLDQFNLSTSNRPAREVARLALDGELDLSPAYQRGLTWTTDQKIGLVRSYMTGVPVPAVIINDRLFGPWPKGTDGSPEGWYAYATIDGKQRISATIEWFTGELLVPASWFSPDSVTRTEDTDDGPYVRYTDLTDVEQRAQALCSMLPMIEAKVSTVEEEAELYLLVNGAGTPQQQTDMDRAAVIAHQ